MGEWSISSKGRLLVFSRPLSRERNSSKKIGEYGSRVRFHHGSVQTNPPLVILQDRGNVYILRKKVEGIHFEEGLEQLRTSPYLKEMNRAAGIDRVVVTMVNEIKEWLRKVCDSSLHEEIDDLAFFVPWDLQKDIPKLMVDDKGVSLHNVWIA